MCLIYLWYPLPLHLFFFTKTYAIGTQKILIIVTEQIHLADVHCINKIACYKGLLFSFCINSPNQMYPKNLIQVRGYFEQSEFKILSFYYSKTCLKGPLKMETKTWFSRQILAKCRSKVLQNAPREHSAILSNFIKLQFVFKTFILSFLSDRLRQVLLYNLKLCDSKLVKRDSFLTSSDIQANISLLFLMPAAISAYIPF